jgi:hypothetical protein
VGTGAEGEPNPNRQNDQDDRADDSCGSEESHRDFIHWRIRFHLFLGFFPHARLFIACQKFVHCSHRKGAPETDVITNGFGLAFGSRDATDTRSELGTRFDRVLAVYSNAVLALRGRVAWAHDWVSDATLLPVFQSLPGASFIVNGATLPKNSALTSAGAELRLANGVTLLAKFDGEFSEFLPFRNPGLGALAVSVLPIPFAKRAAATACAAV